VRRWRPQRRLETAAVAGVRGAGDTEAETSDLTNRPVAVPAARDGVLRGFSRRRAQLVSYRNGKKSSNELKGA